MSVRRLLACLALVCVSCRPAVHVGTAHDPSADHSRYRTFAMIEPNRPIPSKNTDVDPFVLLRLRQLTYLQLKSKGYKPVPKARAQILVGVNAARDEEIYLYSSPYLYDTFYGPMWRTRATRIEEGVVVIDLVDREKKSVVWRGTGVRALNRSFKEEELQEVVAAILAEYPPSSKRLGK